MNHQNINERRKKYALVFKKPSKTHQSFKEECDINNVLRIFEKTGVLPNNQTMAPQYGNFAEVSDYQTALNTVIQAQEQFESLPAKVRERFKNEPAEFLQFCSNPKNQEEMIKLGLAVRKKGEDIPTPKPSKKNSANAEGDLSKPDSKNNSGLEKA